MENKILNIIILGPQGSGKGSQANLLVEKFNLHHVETGKIFRRIASHNTVLGKRINKIMNKKGQLIPTDYVIKILKSDLSKVGKNKGMIFDGYPRNLKQAKALDSLMKLIKREVTHVIIMPISKKTTIKRLSLRLTCKKCDRIFIKGKNIKSNTKSCPVCHGQIYHREDDKPRAISRRLNIYNHLTKPMIEFYQKKGLVNKISGEPTIKVVYNEILKLLK